MVVFENSEGNVLGFASTKEFLSNLNQLTDRNEFELALNSEQENFTSYATKNLTSFHISAKGNSIEEISEYMIKENLSQTVSDIDSERYYLNLSSLFELR